MNDPTHIQEYNDRMVALAQQYVGDPYTGKEPVIRHMNIERTKRISPLQSDKEVNQEIAVAFARPIRLLGSPYRLEILWENSYDPTSNPNMDHGFFKVISFHKA